MDKTLSTGYAAVTGGFLLPIFEFLYGKGGGSLVTPIPVMAAVTFFIFMDWVSGSRAAHKDETYASRYGIDGIFRTFFMLLFPAGGHLLDQVFGLPSMIFGIFAIGLLWHTLKSMTANIIRAGWADWLPVRALEKVTEWVGAEIESKLDRALKRKAERSVVE